MKVELDVPERYEKEVKELAKEIDWNAMFLRAIRNELQKELEIALLKKIASKSKLTEEDALRIGDKIKEGIAKRHGLL